MSPMTTDSTLEEARQELRYVVTRGVDIARRAQRDQERRRWKGDDATLARLRGKGASSVKRWLWNLTERETIRYSDSQEMLGSRIENVFRAGIPHLEANAQQASESTRIRLEQVINVFNEWLEEYEAANEAVEAARKERREREQKRFAVNSKRARRLRSYADAVATTYDLCDNLGIEFKLRINPRADQISDLLSEAMSARPDEPAFVQDLQDAQENVVKGEWLTAWRYLYDAADRFKRTNDE